MDKLVNYLLFKKFTERSKIAGDTVMNYRHNGHNYGTIIKLSGQVIGELKADGTNRKIWQFSVKLSRNAYRMNRQTRSYNYRGSY